MTSCDVIIGTVYGRFGYELAESGMISEKDWTPLKRNNDWDALDAEIVALWKGVIGIVHGTPIGKLKKTAEISNKAIEKLPEDEREANQLLLAIHLFEKWLEGDCVDFITRSVFLSRTIRIKWDIIKRVRKVGGEELAAKTYIAADNIYRAIVGKPVLTSELRNKHAEMVKARLKK